MNPEHLEQQISALVFAVVSVVKAIEECDRAYKAIEKALKKSRESRPKRKRRISWRIALVLSMVAAGIIYGVRL